MGGLARSARILVLAGASLLAFPAASAPGIVLLGDDHRSVIMRDVAASESTEIQRRGDIYELDVRRFGVAMRTLAPGGAITELADALHASEIGLVVVDATRGISPAVREHIVVARQARTPMLAVMLVNVERLHQKAAEESDDLLSLEIEDIRDLLAGYGFDADSTRIFFDARPAAVETQPEATGIFETLGVLSLFGPRRAGAAALESTGEIWGAVYLLGEAETNGEARTLSPNDSLVVWSEGMHANATLASLTAYHPGDFREMPLSMQSPIEVREGSRILLVSGERVVGLGAVTQIGR